MNDRELKMCYKTVLLVSVLVVVAQCQVHSNDRGIEEIASPPARDTEFLTPTPPAYDFEYDFTEYIKNINRHHTDKIGSPHCSSKVICEDNSTVYQSFPEKNCNCDSLCSVLQDCCPDYKPPEAEVPKLSHSVLQCVLMEAAVKTPGIGVYMVTKCDDNWPDGEIKTNCESYDEKNDTLLRIPVSEPINNILFRNMYCSFCNFFYDFSYWKMFKLCTDVGPLECMWEIQPAFPEKRNRMCPLQHTTGTCGDSLLPVVSQEDATNCQTDSYSLVYSGTNMYRNKYCAVCNGIQEKDMFCEPELFQPLPTADFDRRSYSFRMLVDFNSGHLEDRDGQTVAVLHHCKDNERYDPKFDKCRQILCPVPLIAMKGRCVYSDNQTSVQFQTVGYSSSLSNCTLTKLEPSEFEFTNASQVYMFSSRKVYSEEEFQVSGSDVFVCLEMNQTCPECRAPGVMFPFDEVERYLSFVTLIVSLAALAITFIIYIYFNELLNTPGKILVSLIVSLFLAQLMFLISPSAETNPKACKAVSVLMHYFFLAAFCWMNIVALDLWMTFSRQFISPGSGRKSVKRFLKFSIYGWMVPLMIVCVALIVDFCDIGEKFANLKPRYGSGVCWITSGDALLLFFAGPLGVFKLFDIVAFIFTSIHIFRAKRQGAVARQETDVCSFVINLKLSLVMGLTWVFAFLANIGNVPVLWYLFIVFNCLQGLFIAISFLCSNKVQRLIRSKYEEVSGSKSLTQLTSLTPSNDKK